MNPPVRPGPVVNPAVIPALRPDYDADRRANWLARHEELVRLARSGTVDVAFFGDSLTQQWNARGAAEWDRCFAPLRAGNFGVSGDRTQQVLWRMHHGELDGLSPRLLVLLIGTNNLDPGLGENCLTPRNTAPEIIAGVTEIVDLVRGRLPATRVLVHRILPRGASNAPVRAEIAAINTGLGELADGRYIHFLDLGATFLEADGSLAPEIMPDQLHLSEAGYRRWAAQLQPVVTRLLT